MRAYLTRAVALVCIVLVWSNPMRAQELFGTLRRADGLAPAAGTVVLVVRVANDSVVARAVTGEAGTYRVLIPSDSVLVRALRIGQQPQELGSMKLGIGESRELSAVLPDAPVNISAIRTRVNSRCGTRTEGAALVARLFADARTALLASQLASPDGRPMTRYRLVTELWRPQEDRLLHAQYSEMTSDSLRPFQSVSADSLALVGYVSDQADGSTIYRAPDADVLVSDQFLAEHCLSLVEGTAERAGWIGVGFRPARSRQDITSIEGTLWLDRATAELRRLEFGYVGLEPVAARTKPGGWLEFTRLENGIWFVNQWQIRMPRMANRVSLRMGRSGLTMSMVSNRLSLIGIQIVSGEVLHIDVSFRPRYATGARDSVHESGALLSAAMDAHGDPAHCVAAPLGALVYGTIRSTSGAVLSNADVQLSWRADGASGDPGLVGAVIDDAGGGDAITSGATPPRRTRTDAAGWYRYCGVPYQQLVAMQVWAEGHDTARFSLRASPARDAARIDVMLWQPRADGMALFPNSADLTLPALPDVLARPVAERDAPVPVTMDTRRSIRVIDERGAPIPFASVTVGAGPVQTTDSTGTVRFAQDSTRTALVRVQRVGFAPVSDTVMYAATAAPVVVTMRSIVNELEAVRVSERLAVRRELSEFERRRRAGFGRIVDSTALMRAPHVRAALQGTPGVNIVAGLGTDFQILGRDQCRAHIWLDGVISDIDEVNRIPPANLAAVEFYANVAFAPARFIMAARDLCAVALFWTKSGLRP